MIGTWYITACEIDQFILFKTVGVTALLFNREVLSGIDTFHARLFHAFSYFNLL